MLKFVGIGAQKAGTTWLFEHLRRHPAIGFPAGKEVHFWDARFSMGIAWYESLFCAPTLVEGEITPAYAIQPKEVVDVVRQRFPELRLIYVLRNPIERAWSSALMALGRSELEYDEASDQWFLDHFHSRGSLHRGDYEACLRTWRSAYGDEQLLVLLYDDLVNAPTQFLKTCADHIGVEPQFYDRLPESELRTPVFAGPAFRLRPSLKSALQQLYAGKVAALGTSLQRNLDHWMT